MLEIYNHMFEKSSRSILCGDISLDPHLLNLELDKRLGISLLIPVRNDFLKGRWDHQSKNGPKNAPKAR